MSDYYDPHPRLRLSKAVVLGGQIGCGAPAIGRNVASRTGLSFSEVDRVIEHEAGMSLARLVFEDGLERLEMRAELVLSRLVHQSPRGIIVLDRAWIPETARDLLRRQCHFVHVRRPMEYLVERFDAERRRSGDWIFEGSPEAARAAGDPGSVFDRREPRLRESRIVLEAGDQHANRVADLLLESFEQVSGAETL
ncbi:MAG TPA: shikimate kinase [Myxococcota bacterium]|nr:shikimate kinase [Myxococcota bacterium]